jgi:hypothetical protein
MADKDLERLIRKIIKEAPVDYGDYPERMDPKTQRRIEDPENIYAKNRAFKGGVSDVEKIAGTRFKEIVNYVKRYFNTQENITDPHVMRSIMMEQMRAVQQSMIIETSHKDRLKDLAVEIAAKEEGWLDYSLTMSDAIENGDVSKSPIQGAGTRYGFEFINVDAFLNEKKINPSQFQMKEKDLPKLELPPNFSFDIDELTPEEQRQLEIEKRHVINALIQGKGKRGQFSYQAFKDRLDEIDPRLYSLYNKIMSANDLMYFTQEDLIEMMGGNAAGSSSVESDDEDDEEGGEEGEGMDVVVANGLIFPILLHELVKGFASVASREQWRDMDPSMAQDVMGKTDVFSNEPMQFRVGAELVRKLRTLLPDELILDERSKVYIPFFERILYGIPAERFLKEIMSNVVSEREEDNNKVRRTFEDILKRAKSDYQKYKGNDEDEDEEEDDNDILSQLGL